MATKEFTYILLQHPNIEKLDQDLKAAIADIDGVQYFPEEMRLIVVSFNLNQAQGPIDTIVNAHNPASQTQQQLDLTQIQNALQNLRDFRDNPSPTNAQSIATVKLLCRAILYLAKNIYGWE